MNPYPKPTAASRIATFRAKLAEAPVSKLTAAAFITGVVGSLTLGILPDLFARHLERSTATAYEKAQPGAPKITNILPGGERVISVGAAGAVMAFLHLESGKGVYLSSRDTITNKAATLKGAPPRGALSKKLPAALVAITPDNPLRIYNGSEENAEIYISVTNAAP